MGYKILMQVRKPLEDLPTSTNGATSSTKASSPVKAATEKEPNEKDEEARLSREEEKQRLIDIGCPELAAELEQPADAAEQLCKKCKKDPNANAKNVDALSVVAEMILRNNYFVKSANSARTCTVLILH